MSATLGAYLIAYAVISGTTTDHSGALLGGISAMRWDEGRKELTALSDRGPGDGTVAYQPRWHRFGVELSSGALRLQLKETVALRDEKNRPYSGLIVTPLSRIDPEGLAPAKEGGFWVSDEYGPSVHRFDATGRRRASLAVPEEYLPGEKRGRTDNQGFEGLCLSPDGKTLTAALQSSLAQEGGRDGAETRVLVWKAPFERSTPRSYRLPRLAKTAINACVALSDTEYLLLERDGGSVHKTALRARLREDGRVDRGEALDLLAPLVAAGLKAEGLPPKFESLEPGPVVDGASTLWVGLDNDFDPSLPTMVFLLGLR